MNTTSQHYARDLRRYYRMPATQMSLTLVLSLLIMAVFIVLALRPTIVAIVKLQKTIMESRKTVQQLESKVSDLEKASSQLEIIKAALPILNMSITNNGASYDPLNPQIELLASQTGVQLTGESLGPTLLYSRIITPFTPKKDQGVVELPVSIRVTGNYQAVIMFLTQLLNMERMVGVSSVVVTKEAGSREENVGVAMSIAGNAYYLANEAQLETALTEQKGGK